MSVIEPATNISGFESLEKSATQRAIARRQRRAFLRFLVRATGRKYYVRFATQKPILLNR